MIYYYTLYSRFRTRKAIERGATALPPPPPCNLWGEQNRRVQWGPKKQQRITYSSLKLPLDPTQVMLKRSVVSRVLSAAVPCLLAIIIVVYANNTTTRSTKWIVYVCTDLASSTMLLCCSVCLCDDCSSDECISLYLINISASASQSSIQ